MKVSQRPRRKIQPEWHSLQTAETKHEVLVSDHTKISVKDKHGEDIMNQQSRVADACSGRVRMIGRRVVRWMGRGVVYWKLVGVRRRPNMVLWLLGLHRRPTVRCYKGIVKMWPETDGEQAQPREYLGCWRANCEDYVVVDGLMLVLGIRTISMSAGVAASKKEPGSLADLYWATEKSGVVDRRGCEALCIFQFNGR
ncbi:hypothetical protein Tco_0300667 [Tanacetum coccineum]